MRHDSGDVHREGFHGGLSIALDERDRPTRQHCDRVSGLSLELGQRCSLALADLEALRLASALHDIGKIGIPDAVLKKSGRLTEDDWAVMKTHSTRSERIVLAAEIDHREAVARAVRHHHERFDGQGYPDGLSGEAIPILARIVAISDAYDAMARLRMYGAGRAHRAIMDELRRHAGQQHDAYLVARFADVIENSPFKAQES